MKNERQIQYLMNIWSCITLLDEIGKWTHSFSYNSDFRKVVEKLLQDKTPLTQVFAQETKQGNQVQSNSCLSAPEDFMDYL